MAWMLKHTMLFIFCGLKCVRDRLPACTFKMNLLWCRQNVIVKVNIWMSFYLSDMNILTWCEMSLMLAKRTSLANLWLLQMAPLIFTIWVAIWLYVVDFQVTWSSPKSAKCFFLPAIFLLFSLYPPQGLLKISLLEILDWSFYVLSLKFDPWQVSLRMHSRLVL